MTIAQISERQAAENSLREAAKRIRQIIDETVASAAKVLSDDRDPQEEILAMVTEEE